MISDISTFSLFVLGFLFFLFCGSAGFLSGWFVRGFRALKLGKQRDRALSDARAELSRTNHLLAGKTRDLRILDASSKSQIDELRLKLTTKSEQISQTESLLSKNQSEPDSPGSQNSKTIVPDKSLLQSLKNNHPEDDAVKKTETQTDERRLQIRRLDEQKATDYAEMLVKAELSHGEAQTASSNGLENGESTNAFFETDFASQSLNPESPDSSDPAISEGAIPRNQLRIIAKLLERNRELDFEITGLRSTRSSFKEGNGKLRKSSEKEDEQVFDLHLDNIKQLKRKLQDSDKLNSDLQGKTAEIPELKNQINQLQLHLKEHGSLQVKLNSLNQRSHSSEERNLALQSNNTQLHSQITSLKKDLGSKVQIAEQQTAARHLFEQNANEAANALKKQISKAVELELTIADLKSELESQQRINRKLEKQSNERQQFADQLDTLNLQLESGLNRQKHIAQQHIDKEKEMKAVTKKLEHSLEQREAAKKLLLGELADNRKTLEQKTTNILSLEKAMSGYKQISEDQQASLELLKQNLCDREDAIRSGKVALMERDKRHAENKISIERQLSVNAELSGHIASLKQEVARSVSILSDNRMLKEKLETADTKIESLVLELSMAKRVSSESDHCSSVRQLDSVDLQLEVESSGSRDAEMHPDITGDKSASQIQDSPLESVTSERPLQKRKPRVVPNRRKRVAKKCKNKSGKSVRNKPEAPVCDDLKQIHGIGPKLEQLLHEQSITTFMQLAELDKLALKRLAESLGSFGNRIERDNWVRSAKRLVKTQVKKAA